MASLRLEQIAGMNIHYLNYSLGYFLEAQQKIGFKTIEFWGGTPHFWMDHMSNTDCKEIRKEVESHGLKIKAFTPECAIYQYLLCASDSFQHKRSLEYFRRGIRAASDLGATIMGINTMGGLRDEDPAITYERAVKSLTLLGDAAKNEGVTLAVETVRPEESTIITTLPELVSLFRDVAHPNVKILLDLIAMSVAGENPVDWFKTFGKEIIHIHFVDGCPYGHLIWGDGIFPLENYIQVLNDFHYEGSLGQEITDFKYFLDPVAADIRNFEKLRYFCDK